MPIFPRRQLQEMLDGLAPKLTAPKAKDLLRRLDCDDPDQSVPAEYELAVGFALFKVTDMTVAPRFGRSEPDFLSNNIFPGTSAVIEVTALSDDAISGKAAMNRTADIVNQYANTVRHGASNNLHYTFLDMSGFRKVKLAAPIGPFTHKSEFWRKRQTSHSFSLDDKHKQQIKKWLAVWPPPEPLTLEGSESAFNVAWKDWVHPQSRTFSSMPSEIYDLKQNPLYQRLKDKAKRQLASAPEGYLRCIVLGDAGCRLLNHPHQPTDWTERKNGAAVIWKFLKNYPVDIVIILSPQEDQRGINKPRYWRPEIYSKIERDRAFYAKLETTLDQLPRPQLNGYQVRSWVQQGMLEPQGRGMYLPTTYGGNKVKISSRALLELLAGRMNAREYEHFVTGKTNPFEVKLSRGYSITDVKIERHGPTEDDDYIEITFAPDPNAAALRMPPEIKSE